MFSTLVFLGFSKVREVTQCPLAQPQPRVPEGLVNPETQRPQVLKTPSSCRAPFAGHKTGQKQPVLAGGRVSRTLL